MAVQRGRSQVRDAKNNERHVCGRRRGGEPAVPEGESYTFHPPAPSLPRQALFPWPYDEPLSVARTKLADFFNILLEHRAVVPTESLWMECCLSRADGQPARHDTA